jgi:hypothetical protein
MVGSGILVGVEVAVAVAVSVGVAVGVSVGLGVWVMAGVAVGGTEVGLGRVGIKVGSGILGENAIPANAITDKQNKTARTARILNCGTVRPKKAFFCFWGDIGIQEPFTGGMERKT